MIFLLGLNIRAIVLIYNGIAISVNSEKRSNNEAAPRIENGVTITYLITEK